jgi:hypothetical protein
VDAESAAKSNSRNVNSHAARAAAALRARALSSFGHIFEAQTALGQISVTFDAPPRTGGSGNERSMFEGRSSGGEFSRRGDGRSFADAYCYVLKPVSLTLRLIMPVANPLDKPKVEATIAVDPIELFLADRQYALLMRVFGEHSNAWEARSLGLVYRCIMNFGLDEGECDVDRSSSDSQSDESAPDSDADSDDDGGVDFNAIGRARGGGKSAIKPSRASPIRKQAQPPAPLPSRPKFISKHRNLWLRVFHALIMRRRATLREIERHRYLASIAVEYMQLYLRRLKATELQGLPPLSQAERK